jgi:hypothetical protein
VIIGPDGTEQHFYFFVIHGLPDEPVKVMTEPNLIGSVNGERQLSHEKE